MSGPTYPAARAVAADIEAHFLSCAEAVAGTEAEPIGPTPDIEAIEALLSVAFWASLRREEGRSPRISLAFLPPEASDEPLTFGRPLPLDPATLAKLAPAVERPSIHLGIWRGSEGLSVWGTTRTVPGHSFVVEVVEPGLVVVKRRRGRAGAKFANVAVLHGDRVMRIDETTGDFARNSPTTASLLGSDPGRTWLDPLNVIVQLAVSMRGHGHGGTLLIVPDESAQWRESMVHPITYPVDPPYTQLETLADARSNDDRQAAHQDDVRRSVSAIAGLTAVDGATVVTRRYRLLAFGAKIGRRWDTPAVERVQIAEPIAGYEPRIADTAQLGGTRHLSAAQFAHDQPDSVAFVASQDGRFTVFARDAHDSLVHAYRLDALLL